MVEHASKAYCDSIDARVTSLESAAPGGGPTIQHGVTSLTAGQNKEVAFPVSFDSAPTVIVTPQFSSNDASCQYYAHTVTTDGFMLRGAGNPAGDVAWMALL